MRIPESDNIHVKTTIDYDEQHVEIAPLILLPLIENAFQYAISMEKESFIVLNILVERKRLRLFLRNSINVPPGKGTGIGVANVNRRLALLYPRTK